MEEQKKRAIDEARDTLKALSEEVRDLVEEGMFFTINDAIMETLYKNGTHKEFKSYMQWKKEGFQVRKGEKAFLLWARPKDIDRLRKMAEKPKEEKPEATIEDMYKFFPLAYLFSNAQVDTIKPPEAEEEALTTKAVLEPLPYD